MVVDAKKEVPQATSPSLVSSLLLSTSAYSVSVLRPPTSCSIAWDNVNATTSVNGLSNFRS
jgi:hypothetical protein